MAKTDDARVVGFWTAPDIVVQQRDIYCLNRLMEDIWFDENWTLDKGFPPRPFTAEGLEYCKAHKLIPCGPFLRSKDPVRGNGVPTHICGDHGNYAHDMMRTYAERLIGEDHPWTWTWPLPVSRSSIERWRDQEPDAAGFPVPEPVFDCDQEIYAMLWIERHFPGVGWVRLIGSTDREPTTNPIGLPVWAAREHHLDVGSSSNPRHFVGNVPTKDPLWEEARSLDAWYKPALGLKVSSGGRPTEYPDTESFRRALRRADSIVWSQRSAPGWKPPVQSEYWELLGIRERTFRDKLADCGITWELLVVPPDSRRQQI